ncbi:zinc ribbon domain-containing protein [Pseudobutyrivibrio ruminis]|uniref:zinc ribbon domain-containing protein n=1 Tax=Pseudobutyrivibrio ruminis TaxID=46206 RepID=UPI00051C6E88|nr:zinc ribbon domain-containing protein [Pseudobutyrivibrio ruminis]
MYCRKCGRKILDDSSFCSFCGEKILSIDDNVNVLNTNTRSNNNLSNEHQMENESCKTTNIIDANSSSDINRFKCSACGKDCNHVEVVDGFDFCDECKNNYTLLLETHSVIAQHYFNNIHNDNMPSSLKQKLLHLMTSSNNNLNNNSGSGTVYSHNNNPGINTIYTQNNISKIHIRIAIAMLIGVVVIFCIAGISSNNEVNEKAAADEAFDAELNEYSAYNGQIFVKPGYERVCPLTVKTSGTYDYYVYLDYIGAPDYSTTSRETDGTSNHESDMSFYIKGGETLDIDIPIGKYDFYYCSGETFYGPEDKFGSSSSYYKADTVFTFYTDDEYYQGASVTLYTVANGNMDTDPIDAADFPN